MIKEAERLYTLFKTTPDGEKVWEKARKEQHLDVAMDKVLNAMSDQYSDKYPEDDWKVIEEFLSEQTYAELA